MTTEIFKPNPREYYFDPKKWFETSQMAENIWAIREPHHDQNVISYFIKGSTENIIIDSGMGMSDIHFVLLGIDNQSKPTRVLLTHSHWDHMGGSADFSAISVPNSDWEIQKLLGGWKVNEMPGIDIFTDIETPPNFSRDRFSVPGAERSLVTLLNDGDEIEIGDQKILVISTPGHTLGSVSYYMPDKGYLFTGDTIYKGPLYLHMNESDYTRYTASLRKLDSIASKYLTNVFPGHNDTSIPLDEYKKFFMAAKGEIKPDSEIEDNDAFNPHIAYKFNLLENKSFSFLLPRGTKLPI